MDQQKCGLVFKKLQNIYKEKPCLKIEMDDYGRYLAYIKCYSCYRVTVCWYDTPQDALHNCIEAAYQKYCKNENSIE